MEVNGRMIQVIELLFSGDGFVRVEDALKSLDCSQRSLFYNLDKVNAYFAEIGVSPVSRHKGALDWDASQAEQVKLDMMQRGQGGYALSKAERKAVMLAYIATAYNPVTIELLSGLFDASRNTIISEIKELKQELAEIGVALVSLGRGGYALQGDEISIRFKTMECIHSLTTEYLLQEVQQHMLESAGSFIGRSLSDDDLEYMRHVVASCEALIQVKYNYNSINEAVSYLLLIAIRAGKGTSAAAYMEEIEPCAEYEAAGTIIRSLAQRKINIPTQERSYIAAVLLASKLYDADKRVAEAQVDLQGFVEELVDVFSAKACVQFQNRDELIRRLLFHVRPMYYRLRYRIKVRNVLADEIQKRYSGLYRLTEISVRAVEQKYGISVTTEEIAYLCVYIAGWVDERTLLEPQMDENTVLIICGAGVGTSLLLRSQLLTLLGSSYDYRILDERESVSQRMENCALVVSAVDLQPPPETFIKVDPILTRSQQKKILAWSLQHRGSGQVADVKKLLSIIEEHAEIQDRDALAFSLMRWLSDGNAEHIDRGQDLLCSLEGDKIQVLDYAADVEQAFYLACKPLVECGAVRADYHRSIEEIVDRLGLYFEIAPHILLAHGKQEGYVNEVGVALSVFRQPVVFPKWDKEISAVFTLAATDNESHLKILEDIMKLVQNPLACQRLASADFADAQELGAFIKDSVKQQ